MSLAEFRELLQHPDNSRGIPYLSHQVTSSSSFLSHSSLNHTNTRAQNDSMRQQFSHVLPDIESNLPLGDVSFNESPEAVNLWIGDQRSVSSLHKDHYENLYCVVSGTKSFTLFPPTDIAFLPEVAVPTCEYHAHRVEDECGYAFTVEKPTEPHDEKRWICVDPEEGEWENGGLAHPLRCHVRKGETLYLPALWYVYVYVCDDVMHEWIVCVLLLCVVVCLM